MRLKTKGGEYSTANIALTTALMTVGFPWADEGTPCHNVYSNGAKPERKPNGRLKALGAVTYYLKKQSQAFPEMSMGRALDAYDGKGTPGEDLDRLLDGAGSVAKAEVRDLLGPVMMECSRNTLANLKEVKAMPHVCHAHIRRIKPDGLPVVVSENFDPEKAREWGIDMGGQS